MTPIDKLISLDVSNKKRIAVVGDAMTDVYVHGHFGTCQEECYKFVEERRETCFGGAANAAEQLRNWSCATDLFGNETDGFSLEPLKTRFLVNGKFVFRHDNDEMENQDVLEKFRVEFFEYFGGGKPDAILISDYDKGFLTPEFIQQIIKLARERGIPVVADAKREPLMYEGAILKANRAYMEKLAEVMFYRRFPGVIFTDGSENPMIYPPHTVKKARQKVNVVNHVGAGDSFAAHLTLALAHGLSLEEAAVIAHSAGRVYVQHEHNRPPYPHEIRKDIDPVRGKVVFSSTLQALRRSIPGRIVFTNGVFRVPHAGHAWLMRWAKQQGDVLVVGVNDDASASVVKPGEFVMPLEERLEMLCGMDAVDWVIPFSEETPEECIRSLRPNVIVKGSEYAGCFVPGMNVIDDVRFAPVSPYPDQSSSAVVAQIIERGNDKERSG